MKMDCGELYQIFSVMDVVNITNIKVVGNWVYFSHNVGSHWGFSRVGTDGLDWQGL